MISCDGFPIAGPTGYATPAPGEALSRLENAVELLLREWRDGCRAGMAYETLLGSIRRLRQVAVSAQFSAELATLIEDLEAYRGLTIERRPAALTAISESIKRLIPQVATPSSPVRSVQASESAPSPLAVHENRSAQNVLSKQFPSPAALIVALHRLSPSDFEQAVVRLLPHLGYSDVRRTGGAGDLGVDIVCFDEDGGLVAVQCKRYAVGNNVTSPNIQQFFGMLVHHGARHGIYVTTSSFTRAAFDLAAARDIRAVAGTELASLFAAHPEALGIVQTPGPVSDTPLDVTRHPDPSVPVVVPDFYSDTPVHAAREAERAWLSQLSPETPVITAYQSQRVSALTEEQQRAWMSNRERLLALTPEEFRKACILSFVDMWERDKPSIRLLEHENASIKDYVVMHRQQFLQPSISRCHHLPAEHIVTFEQVDRVIRFAGANGCGTAQYWTTGLFSAGALIRAHHHDFGGAAVNGRDIALSLLPDIHGLSTGKDYIALSQQPGWPTKVWEGSERRGLLRRLFGWTHRSLT